MRCKNTQLSPSPLTQKLIRRNLGVNLFADFPSRGLANVLHLKAHNNPNLRDFPGAARFPRVRSLVLSYAYHCCSFLASISQSSQSTILAKNTHTTRSCVKMC